MNGLHHHFENKFCALHNVLQMTKQRVWTQIEGSPAQYMGSEYVAD